MQQWLPELADRTVLTRVDAPLDDTVPTGEFLVWDEAEGGRLSTPPAFQGGGGLVSTVDD